MRSSGRQESSPKDGLMQQVLKTCDNFSLVGVHSRAVHNKGFEVAGDPFLLQLDAKPTTIYT